MSAPQIKAWKSHNSADLNCRTLSSTTVKNEQPEVSVPYDQDNGDFPWELRLGWIATTSKCDSALEGLFQKGLRLVESRGIKAYLLLFPDMIDVVGMIGEAVLERFSPPSQVALELFKDPESDDQYLTVYVRQEQYDEGILDVLDEISGQFDDMLCDTSGWLLITTDFQDPLESNVI